jgi:drug/metabolite transporter (DMT)-like permease
VSETWLTRLTPVHLFLSRQKGYLLVVAAACLWSTSGIFVKQILESYAPTPLALAFWRDALTFAFMFAALGLFRRDLLRIDRQALLPLIGLGTISVGTFHVLWVYAVGSIGVAPAVVLNYTAPAFAVLFAWLLWREPVTLPKMGAVVLAFAGCLLLAQVNDLSRFRLNWGGFLVGLGTGVTWATYAIFGKVVLKRYSSWTVVTYAFGLSALTILLPQPLQTLSLPWSQPIAIWFWLGLLALVPTVAGFCLYSWGLRYLTASSAVITATIETVMAAILAFLVFGDTLDGVQILGGALVVMAIVILAKGGSST